MSITTKRGDDGKTDLFNGQRVSKSDQRIQALAAIDELNAVLGMIKDPQIQQIQSDLFELGAIVANPDSKDTMEEQLKRIEKWEEELEPSLPALQNFILPSGPLHHARTVCRRAETVLQESAYLNRLSDYLFLLARKFNMESAINEVIWKKL